MAQRWDLIIDVLDGPMARQRLVLRGPVVQVGALPGPGGLVLKGYRGLESRHATLTAYEAGQATVGRVGSAQVRMAPHEHVDWNTISAMGTPAYLSEGCAIHLGPPGRGATLRFVGLQPLGAGHSGALRSGGAHRATRVQASRAPFWFAGCLVVMTVFFATVVLAWALFGPEPYEPLGPVDEGEPFYRFTEVTEVDERLLEGVDQPFHTFVMAPNADAAERGSLNDPDSWDAVFHDKVAASMQQHLKAKAVFRRLHVVRKDYAAVVEAMRGAGLPDVFAAIPYLESRYETKRQSVVCANGPWQFMPEVAHRVTTQGVPLKVERCHLDSRDGFAWTPTALTPPRNVVRNADYVDDNGCRIQGCDVDQRTDLALSTAAAVHTLGEAWRDPDLRASGALVQLVIASHNAGYDDSRYGVSKPSNVRPAYLAWAEGKPRDEHARFYGANLTTAKPGEDKAGSALPSETQHYVYTVVAEHFVAVCYYGQAFAGEIRAFNDYAAYWKEGGYCRDFAIPTPEIVQSW